MRDMGIDTFFTYIFYLPLSSVSIIALMVFFNNVQIFLEQCCAGRWIDNIYYTKNLYRILFLQKYLYSDPLSNVNVSWFHLNSFVVIISLLCIPCLIMIRTKD